MGSRQERVRKVPGLLLVKREAQAKSKNWHKPSPVSVLLMRCGAPLAEMDLLIVAHALAHGSTLVSHDQAFANVPGLQCCTPG